MENENNYNAISIEMGDFAQLMRKKYGLNLEKLHQDEITEDAEFEIVEPKQLPPIDNELK